MEVGQDRSLWRVGRYLEVTPEPSTTRGSRFERPEGARSDQWTAAVLRIWMELNWLRELASGELGSRTGGCSVPGLRSFRQMQSTAVDGKYGRSVRGQCFWFSQVGPDLQLLRFRGCFGEMDEE